MKPGIHKKLSPKEYFIDQGGKPLRDWIVSKSLLWDFYKNPRRWYNTPPKEATDAMLWGSMVDCLLTTPDEFHDQYAITPLTYPAPESAKKDAPMIEKPWNWNANYCKEWRENQEKQVISHDTFDEVRDAVHTLKSHAEVDRICYGSENQVAVCFDFPESLTECRPVKCKGLIDIVPAKDGDFGDFLFDLKTTGSLDDLESIEKTIYNFGYHAQAALYLDMFTAITGEERDKFGFIFQLSKPPYDIAIVQLDEDCIIDGREWYLKAIKKWAKETETMELSSPFDGILTAKRPRWVKEP